jgi:hypothetical protein
MFPETYNYKQYASTSSVAQYVRSAAINQYVGTYLTLLTPPTNTETGVIYGQKGLLR